MNAQLKIVSVSNINKKHKHLDFGVSSSMGNIFARILVVLGALKIPLESRKYPLYFHITFCFKCGNRRRDYDLMIGERLISISCISERSVPLSLFSLKIRRRRYGIRKNLT